MCKLNSGAKSAMWIAILILSYLMIVGVTQQAAGANGQWKVTSYDTDDDGTPDLDVREKPPEVHLDLDRDGVIDLWEPYSDDAKKVEHIVVPGGGCIIKITWEATYPAGDYYYHTYKIKDNNGDGDTSDEDEVKLYFMEGPPPVKCADPPNDLIRTYTGQPTIATWHSGYLDLISAEADKAADNLEFRMTVVGAIPTLDQSTLWTILIDENNDLADNCMDYPTANADTMYSVVFDASTQTWTIERTKYASGSWNIVPTSATWSMTSSWPDGNTTIKISVPMLELDQFQGILTWKAMTSREWYIGDMAPDWQPMTMVMELGSPQPRIVGQLDDFTVAGNTLVLKAIEMTPSVDRFDIASCTFEYRRYGDPSWTLVGDSIKSGDTWELTFNTSGLSESPYAVRATMTNDMGLIGQTETAFFYDPTPPEPEFVDLGDGKIIKGQVALRLTTTDSNVKATEFYQAKDETEKEKNVPGVKQDGADDCGPHAAAGCLSYWRNFKDKDGKKPFEKIYDVPQRKNTDPEDVEKAQRKAMAQELYGGVGKKKASADSLVKAIDDYFKKRAVQGLKPKKITKDVGWDTAKKEFDQCQDVMLFLEYSDGRKHWVTLKGHSEWTDGDGVTHRGVSFMDPGRVDNEQNGEITQDGKITHTDAVGGSVTAKIVDIVTVCPTDPKNISCDPYLETDSNGADGWGIQWDTTQEPDGFYYVTARMLDEDGNEGTKTTRVCVDNHIINTSASVAPGIPNGENGWYNTTPSVVLTRDEPGTTYYSWNSSTGPWAVYSTSINAPQGQNILYYYSVDTAGNIETAKNQLFNVDTTPPTTMTLSGYAISSSAIHLSWNAATDSVGTVGYRVYNANTGVQLTSTSATSCSLTDLAADTTFAYCVRAYDTAGNLSAQSNITALTTYKLPAPTQTGSSISVDLGNDTGLTFTQIANPGTTTVVVSDTAPWPPPSGFRFLDLFYDVTTSASYTPPITVAFPYDESQVTGPEANLRLFHWENGAWRDVTILPVDTINNKIRGQVTSLSPFALGMPAGPAVPTGFNTYMLLALGLVSLALGLIVAGKKHHQFL